jgi:hypothetical protein
MLRISVFRLFSTLLQVQVDRLAMFMNSKGGVTGSAAAFQGHNEKSRIPDQDSSHPAPEAHSVSKELNVTAANDFYTHTGPFMAALRCKVHRYGRDEHMQNVAKPTEVMQPTAGL